jgi:hypothetical protein
MYTLIGFKLLKLCMLFFIFLALKFLQKHLKLSSFIQITTISYCFFSFHLFCVSSFNRVIIFLMFSQISSKSVFHCLNMPISLTKRKEKEKKALETGGSHL